MTGGDRNGNALVDDKSVAIAAQSVQESVLNSVVGAIVGNRWIWAPPAGFVGLMLEDQSPLRSGEQGRAEDLWEPVAPILKVHRSADRLVADYESS